MIKYLTHFVAQLLFLEAEDPEKDIQIYINSPGGSVTAGMAIYDTMQQISPDVVTICFGVAASMGAFLLSGGAKGKRLALPNSRIMIHQPLGGAQGQAVEIEFKMKDYEDAISQSPKQIDIKKLTEVVTNDLLKEKLIIWVEENSEVKEKTTKTSKATKTSKTSKAAKTATKTTKTTGTTKTRNKKEKE